MTQYVDPVHLRQVLTQYYSEGELRTMCFDMGIDYESVGGRGKAEKVVELVAYAQRYGRLDQFAAYVRQTREFIQLRMTDTLPELPQAIPGSVGSGTTIYLQGDLVQGDKMTGDRIDMSGDFRGANVNVKSTLTNVTQTVGALPQADDATKAELQRLLAELEEALKQVPADKAQEKQTVEQMTEMLVNAAEQTNKPMMQISAEGLKKAAENLAAVVPNVVKIAGAIVAGILGLG